MTSEPAWDASQALSWRAANFTDSRFKATDFVTTPNLTRGPYLQAGTPKSVIVRWRTDVATDSSVRFGTSQGALNLNAHNPTLTTEHEVALTGLAPDTTYFYSIGTTTMTLAGNDPSHFFVTSPVAGTAKPTRIWVLGDSGTANASVKAVRDAYLNFTGSTHTSLWLMLGDNAYETGTDSEYQAAVFNMFPQMLKKSVLWPTIGNHDTAHSTDPPSSLPYYSIFTLPTGGEAGGLASGTEDYYSFDYGNIHFICLDSMTSDRSANGAMMTWLENDLASTTQQWVIAFWHHPPYSKGSHNSDTETELVEMRQNALPILEAGGVDLVLSGHSHSYERSFLIDGHYGSSSTFTNAMKKDGGDGRTDGNGGYNKATPGPAPHEGAVYAVAGSSGQASGGLLNHPAMFISLNSLGSMVLDVNGGKLDAKFLTSTGAVADYLTIIKGPPNGGEDIFTDARLFVMQQYRDFLSREADPAGIAYWTGVMSQGISRAQVIDNFFNSAEFQGTIAPIARLYFAYFLRIPDYGGVLHWSEALRNGQPLHVISENFAQSAEFQQRYGSLTNTEFVTLIYQNILRRAPVQAEVDYWVGHLNAGRTTRGLVMLGFSESEEHKRKIFNEVYVTMMYVGMLRRSPEPEGFDYWVGSMKSGGSGLELIEGFLNSQEYHNRFL